MISETNPGWYAMTYEFDAMGRPNKMTGGGRTYVKDVLYGPAGEMTQMKILDGDYTISDRFHTETRTYNARLQLTRVTVAPYSGTRSNLEYTYSASQNNGQITQMKDWVSGEQVTYQYDSLKRLSSATATGPAWSLAYSYDGFGNRTAQGSTTLSYNLANNRLTGGSYAYDENGNLTMMPGPGGGCTLNLTYDGLNRLVNAQAGSCGSEQYGYGADGRRAWKKTVTGTTAEVIYLYGIRGERLAAYKPVVGASAITFEWKGGWLYFAGRLVSEESQDRLGSVVWSNGTKRSFYPYGEEKGTVTPQEQNKFGTYYRDGVTGLDYAQQRYYSSVAGRFVAVDPYVSSGGVGEPQGWNRYAYVQNDPINYKDPHGLFACSVGVGEGQEVTDCEIQVIAFPEPNPESLPRESRRLKVKTQRVVAQLITIRKTIDSDCLSWLKSGIAGGLTNVFNEYYNALIGADGDPPLAGAGDFIGTPFEHLNASAGYFGNGFFITVNTSGAFFTPLKGVGYGDKYKAQIEGIAPATNEARNFILIHELAHYFQANGFIADDGTNNDRQRLNNDLVWEKCNKTITGMSGPI